MIAPDKRFRPFLSPVEVVMGAFFAGILLACGGPLLASFRGDADRAVCASNLRAIGQAVLAYENEYGHLPGPTRRVIKSPLNPARPGAGLPMEQWASNNVCLSLRLEEYFGVLSPADPGPFFCPANQSTLVDPRRPAYIVMRNIRTFPASFFGDMDFNRPPLPLASINAAGSGPSRLTNALSQIWMIADIDSGNWLNTGIASPLFTPAPHSSGRNYVFFDGRVEYVIPNSEGNWRYPANSGDIGNDS